MKKTNKDRLLASTLFAGLASVGLPMAGGVVTMTAATDALAQSYTTVDLAGVVTDDSGSPVSGATVTTTSNQGVSRSATTGADGTFRFSAVPAGTYSFSISASGFSSASERSVQVAPGASNFNFALSSAGDEIVVTAQRVSDFDATDTGTVFDVQELAERIPLGRSINSAVLLTPSAGLADPSIAANGVRRNQSAVSLSGASAAENAYYINGLNVTDQRTFLGYTDLPFEFIQSIQTKTGGYSAEFGRGTGGVVNIVTRSGSNEFHGGIGAQYTPDSLRAERGEAFAPGGNNSVGQNVRNQFSEAEAYEYTLWGSGPIIRDHLFLFGIYNGRDFDNWGAHTFANATTANGLWVNSTSDDPRWALKADFVLNEDHRIEATYINDEQTTRFEQWNVGRNGQILPLTASPDGSTGSNPDGSLLPFESESGGVTQILQYTGNFTDWFTLTLLYGNNTSSYTDSGPNILAPSLVEQGFATPFNKGLGRGGTFNFSGEDERTTYRVGGDFYFDFLGEHHLRVGYDREDLVSSAANQLAGGGNFTAYGQGNCPVGGAGTTGCVNVLRFGNFGEYEAEQTAYYIQDSWELSEQLTLNLGIRQDIYDYLNASGQSYVSIDDQFAPRLGLVWTPSDDTRITASYGQFYLPIATNTSIRASSGELFTDQYFQAVRSGTCVTTATCTPLTLNPDGTPQLGAQIGTTTFLSPPGGPDPRSIVEQDLDPMYESEIALGVEHDFTSGILDGWTMGVRLIHRNLESAIEDTAIGDAVERYCNRTSDPLRCAGNTARNYVSYYPFVLINPGDGATVMLDPEADVPTLGPGIPNPAFGLVQYDLSAADLALPDVDRTYDALVFTWERPFDGTWGLQGSYTYANSRGNYEGAVKSDIGQTDASITQDFDHASNMIGSYGDLPNDRRHTFRLFGTWAPMERLTVGANFLAQSGRPYGCIGYGPGVNVDPLVPNSGTPGGWACPTGALTATPVTGTLAAQLTAAGIPAGQLFTRNRNLVGRGSVGETDWVNQLDLSLSYRFLGNDEDERGRLVGTIDVFNVFDNDAVTRVVEQGEVRTSASGLKGVAAPYYGLPRTYQGPRTVRFGVRYEF